VGCHFIDKEQAMTAILLATILATLAGIAAALVLCRAVHFPIAVDMLLGCASLYLASVASHAAGDSPWPWLGLAAGYLLAVLAMRWQKLKPEPVRQSSGSATARTG
jgi:hypothetical protein